MNSFDEIAGLSEGFERKLGQQKRAYSAARRDAAQAEYDRTGKMPEGFQMVFGTVAAVQPKIPASPAEVAQAAQDMTGQPAAPAQVVRQKITKMPPHGLGRRGGFYKNIANGHVKADDLAPEFWESLPSYEKKKVEDALAKASGVKPVVSDVDFNTMLAMMEATSFDEMCGLGSRMDEDMSFFDRIAGLDEGSMGFKALSRKIFSPDTTGRDLDQKSTRNTFKHKKWMKGSKAATAAGKPSFNERHTAGKQAYKKKGGG